LFTIVYADDDQGTEDDDGAHPFEPAGKFKVSKSPNQIHYNQKKGNQDRFGHDVG
jgi:hypothetical protein